MLASLVLTTLGWAGIWGSALADLPLAFGLAADALFYGGLAWGAVDQYRHRSRRP